MLDKPARVCVCVGVCLCDKCNPDAMYAICMSLHYNKPVESALHRQQYALVCI